MENIETLIKACNICGNYPKPICNSFIQGKSNILIIGESPAKNGWLISGKAFYNIEGKLQGTGKILNKYNSRELISNCLKDLSYTNNKIFYKSREIKRENLYSPEVNSFVQILARANVVRNFLFYKQKNTQRCFLYWCG